LRSNKKYEVSIIGIVGLPANYGGFETLAQNLVFYHDSSKSEIELNVYCSGPAYQDKKGRYSNAKLTYLPFRANGFQSVVYDMLGMLHSVFIRKSNCILILGVSGAILIPFLRFFSDSKIIVNIDGIEWRRDKWGPLAKMFLKFSERIAVKWSNVIISDNEAIANYVHDEYKVASTVIAYGGDHVLSVPSVNSFTHPLPSDYSLSICRIEPENNIQMILEAFSRSPASNLVMVGNWDASAYGSDIRSRYSSFSNLYLLDPIYDLAVLGFLRSRAEYYIHGHSAGGTNPSLVEAMYFAKPVLAFDCAYNRYTTDELAVFFSDGDALRTILALPQAYIDQNMGVNLRKLALAKYTWNVIARKYFSLF
jgi:glycosyltransferase involved in cell wall biosynthesis